MAAPKKIDYGQIESGWRAGILSPPQLAAEYTAATGVKVSHTAIIKHFSKRGIPRDLKAKIAAKAEAMVAQAMVTGTVSTETKVPDAKIVSDNAQVQANVMLAQRRDIGRARDLATKLLQELEQQTDGLATFEQLLDALAQEAGDDEKASDRRKRLWEQWQKAMSLGARADTMKKLSDTLRILIDKEREAYGMDVSKESDVPTVTVRDLTGRKPAALHLVAAAA